MRNKKHRDSDITSLLAEARQKYGNDFVLINTSSEANPNWTIKHRLPKGNGGIREREFVPYKTA
ncbi:cytoplasmic protein [Bacillus thuringiensis]|uniref:hypothetical protein n=1 Tax=Bacillus thuringiensis TaxID=1428 RepID=UPI000A38569F|nr:hypothetical protein [Bacillus thuringiensis]PEX92996.1 cytoplasmic protein [Bacillus cereus]MED3350099.1 cytoplasmic protein [Bacillus thuringiensis]MRB11297.1 cytoplasmic protein [Bacillus thuringiensis]OTW88951.1 hypothetical protein BK710_11335 [Bacillus thuringiensis serovar sumiyoshiensis]OTW95780.1 hypothetical protein BK711_20500 [Bacillus thuringiensis serovar fukuokaensis]